MFKLRIGWIDTSYWDDGSRYTSTTKEFATLEEADNFVAKHLREPYPFQGQSGTVHHTIDPKNLYLTEVCTTEHDVFILPSLKESGIEKYRTELRNIAKWGGDLKAVETRARQSLGWERAEFLREWEAAIKETVTK